MKICFYWFAALAGLAGTILSLVMVIQAWQYMEWGRVFVYGFLLIISAEVLCLFACTLLRARKSEEST